MLRTQALPENLVFSIHYQSAAIPPATEKKIEEIWESEKAKRGNKLFNGPLLSLIRLEGTVLEARVVDYRSYLAQTRAPELFSELGIRALAVSGLVAAEGKIAFGRRATHLTQDAKKWELVPSGGLSPRTNMNDGNALIEEQILEELAEELGVPHSAVTYIRPFLVVEDMEAHVVDIGIDVSLSINSVQIKEASQVRSDEYSEIRWVDSAEIDKFYSIKEHGDEFVAVSLELLKAKRLLRT
jgi:hypothetical protein